MSENQQNYIPIFDIFTQMPGKKATKPREVICRVLEEMHKNGERLSVEEIKNRAFGPSATDATTYRFINELEEVGLIRHIPVRDGRGRYEIRGGTTDSGYVYNELTGDLKPFSLEKINKVLAAILAEHELTLTVADIVLYGSPKEKLSKTK